MIRFLFESFCFLATWFFFSLSFRFAVYWTIYRRYIHNFCLANSITCSQFRNAKAWNSKSNETAEFFFLFCEIWYTHKLIMVTKSWLFLCTKLRYWNCTRCVCRSLFLCVYLCRIWHKFADSMKTEIAKKKHRVINFSNFLLSIHD